MATVAAVVVTYNRKALLMQCIERIRAQRGASCRIYVIDNASTDGTEQAVQQLCGADLLYCNTGKNLGGAGGFWYGLRRAAEDGCDYFWLMDDDTLPEPDALALLLQADTLLKGRYGWLSSRALTLEGADQPMNRQRKTPYRDIDGYDAELVPSVMASFVSLFLPAKTVFLYGLPFREFFIWSDDWEYTRRISRQEACYVVPSSRVIHAMQSSTVVNISKDSEQRLPRYRFFYRNDVVLYRREGLRGWLWLIAKDFWHTAQVLLSGCPDKAGRLKILWGGFAAGVRFHPVAEFPKIGGDCEK